MKETEKLEFAIIGCILNFGDKLDIPEFMSWQVFEDERRGLLYGVLDKMIYNKITIDTLSVYSECKKLGFDFTAYEVAIYSDHGLNSGAFDYHCHILYQYYIRRKLISLSVKALDDSQDVTKDVFEIQEKIVDEFQSIISFTSNSVHKTSDVASKFFETNKNLVAEGKFNGVKSDFIQVDDIIGGWTKQDLIILAGRPSMGKTALCLSYIINALKQGKTVVFASLEMGADSIWKRIASMCTGINLTKFFIYGIRGSDLEKYNEFLKEAQNWKLIIFDKGGASLRDIRNILRQIKDVDLLVVDYLQLIIETNSKYSNRNDEVTKISNGLKTLAKDFNIPVIALSQLSRSVEQRGGNKIPMLSDLRDSGSIEQDADVVQFVHRPEYYGVTEDEQGNSLLNVANIIIPKNRNGKIGTAVLHFQKETTLFKNMEDLQGAHDPVDFTEPNSMKVNQYFDDEKF